MPNLVRAIEEQERLASNSGSLTEERQKALDLYLGRPYGDEQDGRSKVVMRDVADTIEWIKPSLMKVFCSGDEIARFDPVGPEDEQQAQQETDYVNHILMQKNDGFQIFYDWFHDALLQKNGYVFVRNCEERVSNREQYKGLTDDEFAMLAKDDECEVLEHTEYSDAASGTMYHDCVVRQAGTYRYLKISNIPPERVLVASDWPSLTLKGCPFFEIIDWKTISDLRNEGYDVPDDINDSQAYADDEFAEQQRNVESMVFHDRRSIEADPPTRRVKVRYVWMLWDADGDGIAELRHIVICGTTLLNGEEGEEDDLTPAACLCPIRMPHEHNGQSIADIVEDLQRIRTVLVRGYLDNMYLANNGQYAIDVNRVNLDDMLTSRPGGVKRVDGDLTGAIMPLVHPQVGGDILSAVEYIDTVRENRTGVTRYNQGMDANSLNKTATGINIISNAAAQRIELIARLFAETGVKHLMLIVHAMSMKTGREPEIVKLRGQWVPVDPRTWKTRRDMTVSVGLGNGNKDQMLQHLQMIAQMQAQGVQIGIATPENIYNTARRFTQNAGFKNADEFWTDPQKNPMPQAPNPLLQAEQLKQQGAMELHKASSAEAQMKAQADAQLKADAQKQQMAYDAAEADKQRAHEYALAKLKMEESLAAARIKEESAIRQQGQQMQADVTKEVTNTVQKPVEGHMQNTNALMQQVFEALSEVIGHQPTGIEYGKDGRAAAIKRRNGTTTPIVRNETGQIAGLQ